MALTYNEIMNDLVDMTITVNGKEYKGKFADFRFDTNTLPYPMQAYNIRYSDKEDSVPGSITRCFVMVNFFGIFICESIKGLESRDAELDIEDYCYMDEYDDSCIDVSELNTALRKFILEKGEVVETLDGATTEMSIHIGELYVKGTGLYINELIADTEWDEVILSDCKEADLNLEHLDEDELKQLINSIYGFEYEC